MAMESNQIDSGYVAPECQIIEQYNVIGDSEFSGYH